MRRYDPETVDTAVRTIETSGPGRDEPSGSPSGARSGALVAAASLAGIALNYAFLLAAGRFLGVEDYGALAALLGILTVVLLPLGAVQMAVSRDVARQLGAGDAPGAAAFARAVVRASLLPVVPIVGVALLLAWPLGRLLDIDPWLVGLAAGGLATAFLLPAALGVLQGYQRFRLLAAVYVLPFLLRLVLLGAAVAAGLRLGGAVLASVLAILAAGALAAWLVREPVRSGAARVRPSLRGFARYLVPVSVGLVGIAVLTNVDVLVVRARFPAEEAGLYAAASAFARVAFFLPATILAVLFPRTAARQARGEQTEDILGRALLVTGGFSGLLAVAYVLTGEGLVVSSFGAEFADAGVLLPAYALAMGLYSLANVLAGYHLSRGESRYAWIVAAAVPVQVGALALVPESLEAVVWTNVAVGVALLVAHELAAGPSLPALRAGGSRLVPEPLALRLRSGAREGGIALAAYSALAVLVTWPLAARMGSTFIGDERNDAAGTIAWLWRLGQEGGYQLFGTATHHLTGAPFGWEEGNALNLQWLLPYYPASLLAPLTGEVLAYNAVVLSGLALSALAMYGLARYLGCRPLVAGWAGVAFLLLPWLVWRVNAGHASLVHVWVLPLLLLTLAAWTARPTTGRAALVGLATTAAWLTSGYFGVMAVVGAGAYLAAVTVARRRSGWRPALRASGVAAAALVLGTLVVGIASLPGRAEGGAAIERHVSNLWVYGARPAEFVLPPSRHPVLGPLADPLRPGLHGSNVAETTLFLGWTTLLLAGGWLLVVLLRRREAAATAVTAGLVAAAVAAFLFALASPLRIAGLDLEMPSWLLFQVIPEARVPSRFAALLAAALVPLAALGLQALADRVRRGGDGADVALRRSRLVVGLVVLVTAFELAPSVGKPLDANVAPAAYEALAALPDGVLAEYPLGPPGTNAALEYGLWQRVHGRRTLNGARAGSTPDEARLTLLDPGAPGTAEALALLGVTAIVTRGDALGYVHGIPEGRTPAALQGYELVGRFPDEYALWRVAAAPAPALVAISHRDVGDPLPPRAGFVGLPLAGGEARIELRAPRAGAGVLSFRLDVPRGTRVTLTGAAGQAKLEIGRARELVSVPVSFPRGVSSVTLRLTREGARISPPRVVAGDLDPAVRALLHDRDPGF